MPRNNRTNAPRGGRFVATGRGEIRIIGGEWRGRKLHFPHLAGLRPTPDRVRETVFNWLQFDIAGTHCLDLFAGSGALGFEALSRGAAEVVFVEREPAAAAAIRKTLDSLRCDRGRVEQQDAFGFLATAATRRPFDVVFLDPPYDQCWPERASAAVEQGGWLGPSALIYLEDAASRGAPPLPPGWTLLRSKTAGDVGYHLARRDGAAMTTNTKQQGRA